jgi:glycosyltransferase involved in cell wall biosynthesis
MPGEISDAHRTWLYENCDALLFPSLSEGFGLPVVEAMAHGKPVFMSDRTSLPEVGGSLGFYWKDFSPAHMLQVFQTGMATFRQDPEYARKLSAHAKSFSWQHTAAEYLKLYAELLAAAGEDGHPSRRHAA